MDSFALVLFMAQSPSPSAAADPALELFLLVQVALPAAWGFLIPFLTELFVKAQAPAGIRTFAVALLSTLGSIVSTITLTGLDSASWVDYLSAILAAWLVAGRVYVAGMADPVARATPNIGVGTSTTAVRQ